MDTKHGPNHSVSAKLEDHQLNINYMLHMQDMNWN